MHLIPSTQRRHQQQLQEQLQLSKIVVNRVGDGLKRVGSASDPWKQHAESIEGRLKNS
jgi:hypothetical protein